MFVRKVLTLAALLGTLICLSGCGKRGGFATVSGVVTLDGVPVEGAKIAFHSTVEVDGKAQPGYGAQTDSSGKYVIATSGKDLPGIPPGLYKVTIVKYEGGTAPQEGMDAGQIDAQLSDGKGSTKGGPVNLLPQAYANVATSKLSATLEVGANKDVNFTLKGK
jgi:hypothetical protein